MGRDQGAGGVRLGISRSSEDQDFTVVCPARLITSSLTTRESPVFFAGSERVRCTLDPTVGKTSSESELTTSWSIARLHAQWHMLQVLPSDRPNSSQAPGCEAVAY